MSDTKWDLTTKKYNELKDYFAKGADLAPIDFEFMELYEAAIEKDPAAGDTDKIREILDTLLKRHFDIVKADAIGWLEGKQYREHRDSEVDRAVKELAALLPADGAPTPEKIHFVDGPVIDHSHNLPKDWRNRMLKSADALPAAPDTDGLALLSPERTEEIMRYYVACSKINSVDKLVEEIKLEQARKQLAADQARFEDEYRVFKQAVEDGNEAINAMFSLTKQRAFLARRLSEVKAERNKAQDEVKAERDWWHQLVIDHSALSFGEFEDKYGVKIEVGKNELVSALEARLSDTPAPDGKS